MLFGLLANRFPWTVNLAAEYLEQTMASQRLSEQTFDNLEDEELNNHFGHIVRQCLNVEYKTGTDLLEAMRVACADWRRDRSPVCPLILISTKYDIHRRFHQGNDIIGRTKVIRELDSATV